MNDTAKEIHQARLGGDPEVLADALVRHANALLEQGQPGPARDALDEAAGIHRQHGWTQPEARATHLSATVSRLRGDLDGAAARAEHAASLSAPATPERVAAWTELGEIGLARRDGAAAAAAYETALQEGRQAGLLPQFQGALLRRRAEALARCGRLREAAAALREAQAAFLGGDAQAGALRAQIEEASAWSALGEPALAQDAVAQARAVAAARGDMQALADLSLVDAAQAVSRGDLEGALRAAQAARTLALQGVAPLAYVAAALALAEVSELQGDRAGAYGALAVGWVTLSDLLGKDLGRATFAPPLRLMHERWGAAEFQRVKQTYESTKSS